MKLVYNLPKTDLVLKEYFWKQTRLFGKYRVLCRTGLFRVTNKDDFRFLISDYV